MILLALGGNRNGHFGEPRDTFLRALDLLQCGQTNVADVSGLYQTKAVGPGRQADYLNAVALLKSGLSPVALLRQFKRIESASGRKRGVRWGSRTLDLDLLAYNSMVAGWGEGIDELRNTPRMPNGIVVPHPRLDLRSFVLRPLMDIAPKWRHPVLGLSVAQMWMSMQPAVDLDDVKQIEKPDWY